MMQSPEAIGPGQEFCKSAYAWIVRRRFYLIIIGSFSLPLFLETEYDYYQNPNPTTTVMSNGGDCRYEIAQNAYIKLVLHALKHKTSAVNGVLLGRLSGDVVEITESVPLFHSSQIGLLPPLEISLIMIEEYYSSQGLSIVGYFHANERFDDIELGTVAKNIADHVHLYFPQAAVLLLDNKKLGALQNKKDAAPVMQLYTRDSSRSWKQVESNGANRLTTKEPSANIVLLDFTSSEKWNDIVDFDDHLDDISKDWLNSGLFK